MSSGPEATSEESQSNESHPVATCDARGLPSVPMWQLKGSQLVCTLSTSVPVMCSLCHVINNNPITAPPTTRAASSSHCTQNTRSRRQHIAPSSSQSSLCLISTRPSLHRSAFYFFCCSQLLTRSTLRMFIPYFFSSFSLFLPLHLRMFIHPVHFL